MVIIFPKFNVLPSDHLVLALAAKSLAVSSPQSMTIASVLASTVPIPVSWLLIWLDLGSTSGKQTLLTEYVLYSFLSDLCLGYVYGAFRIVNLADLIHTG